MAAVIDTLLRKMMDEDGSDLHLMVGMGAKIRAKGGLMYIPGEESNLITSKYMQELLVEICPQWRWDVFIKNRDLDFAYEIEGLARFRCNYLYNHYGKAAVFRQIPSKILTMEDLNLPTILREICHYTAGLILVTGPTGSGKSTTLAAMIDYINTEFCKNIVTIEDPIEFVHPKKTSFIFHREVGEHSGSFMLALRGAMRADPDIILVGEMRELETIKLALDLASMGMLVFATLHTNNAPKTIDRIIDVFPANEQAQIRTMLSECLTAVVSQLLCKTSDGKGRVAVHEILFRAEGLSNTIREGQIANIRSIIEQNRQIGMCSMDGSLRTVLDAGLITGDEAYLKATSKKEFEEFMDEDEIL